MELPDVREATRSIGSPRFGPRRSRVREASLYRPGHGTPWSMWRRLPNPCTGSAGPLETNDAARSSFQGSLGAPAVAPPRQRRVSFFFCGRIELAEVPQHEIRREERALERRLGELAASNERG